MEKFARYEAYKGSGIEWLGEIPTTWNKKRFKFIAHTKKGKLPKKIVSDDIGLPPYLSMDFLRGSPAEQFIADRDAHIVQNGETLLLWDGSNAGEFLQAKYGVVSSTVAHVIFVKSINKKYAWYYSKFLEIQLRQTTIGMGIPHVSADELNELMFCEPSRVEQKKIVAFLDQKTTEIDEAIAKKQSLIELLNEQKSILINQAVTKGLNPDVPMQDSGVEWIGKIPEHWQVVANRVVFNEVKEPGNELLPILSVSLHTAVSLGEQSGDENIRAKIRIEDKSSYKRVATGDIVFNMMRAWQGAIGAVRVEGMVSPAYIVARPKFQFNADYFEYLYRTMSFIQQMDRNSKGITDFRKRLYWDEFKQLITLLPPLAEQEAIANYCVNIIAKTDEVTANEKKVIDKLQEFKQTLIAHAVTGKIKV